MATRPGQEKAKQNEVWFGYDLSVGAGPVLKPQTGSFWTRKNPSQSMRDVRPTASSDSLLGLSHFLLAVASGISDKSLPLPADPQFMESAWSHMEPHAEIYERTQERLKPFKKMNKAPFSLEKHEPAIHKAIQSALEGNTFQFSKLNPILDLIDDLETECKRPLLFNMNIDCSKEVLWKLHLLYSMLFHTRSIVGADFNSNSPDVTHAGVRVDSITDYLPKSEYVANDAILYWHFKTLKQQMQSEASQVMEKAFWDYAHNGACLIESLPVEFLKSQNPEGLEKSLYTFQMDWLLGTPAGLLFKIREELFGMAEGYHKVFWHDHEADKPRAKKVISFQCHVSEKQFLKSSGAA